MEPSLKKFLDMLRENPKDLQAFKTLEGDYYLNRCWSELVDLYQLRAQAIFTNNPQEASLLYYKRGEILHERLSRKEEAIEAYEMAIEFSKKRAAPYRMLVQLYLLGQQWERACEVLERLVVQCGQQEDRVWGLLELGRLCAQHLAQPEKAQEYYNQILELEPQHSAALQALEQLLSSRQDHHGLLALYDRMLSWTSEPHARASLLLRKARLAAESLNQQELAIKCYEEILELGQEDLASLGELERLYRQAQQWESMITVLDKRLALITEEKERARLLIHIATLLQTHLHDLPAAAARYQEAWELAPSPQLLKSWECLARQMEDWKLLVEIYQKQWKILASPNEQADLAWQLSQLIMAKLEDRALAIHWCRLSLHPLPQPRERFHQLQELLRQEGRFSEMLDVYSAELAVVESQADKIEIMLKMATTKGQQLSDAAGAAATYQEILALDPHHSAALEGLKWSYRTLEDYPRLVQLLQEQVNQLQNPRERIPLYLELAGILQEKIHDEAQAVAYYQKILEIDEKDLDVLEKLKNYYQRHQRYQELIFVLRNICKWDPSQAVKLKLEIGAILWNQVQDLAAAAKAYQEVLELEPHSLQALEALREIARAQKHSDEYIALCQRELEFLLDTEKIIAIHQEIVKEAQEQNLELAKHHLQEILKLDIRQAEAARQLKKIYAQQEEWGCYIALLEQETTALGSHKTLFARYIEIAQLALERTADREKAIAYYEKAYRLQPTDQELLERLDRLYAQEHEQLKRIAILQARAALAPSENDRAFFWATIGEIYEKLKDEDHALAAYRQAWEHDPFCLEVLERLEVLYLQRKAYPELAQVYSQQIAVVKDPPFLLQTYLKAGALWQEHLADPEQAIWHYEQALRIDYRARQAVTALITLYTREEQWEALANLYARQLELQAPGAEEYRASLAQLYEEKLQQFDQALPLYREMLSAADQDAQKRLLPKIQMLCEKLGDWTGLVQALEQELEPLLTPEEEHYATQLRKMARIYEVELGDYQQAISCQRRLLELSPEDLDIIQTLQRLYRQRKDYQALERLLTQEIALTDKLSLKLPLLFEKASICRHELQQPEEAIQTLQLILDLDPHNYRALEELAAIYREEEAWGELIMVLGREAQITAPAKSKALYVEMARLLEEHLGDTARAREQLHAALAIDNAYLPALHFLQNLHKREQEWEALIQLYEQEARVTSDVVRRQALLLAVGQIWEEHCHNSGRARAVYHQIVEADAHHLPALYALQRIAVAEELPAEALDAYEHELEVPGIDEDRRIALHIACAEIQEQLLQEEAARAHYRQALQLDEENLTAIRGLQQLEQKAENYEALVAMYQQELRVESDQQRLAEVHMALATVAHTQLNDPHQALEHYRQAYHYRPTSLPLIDKLIELYRLTEQWSAYVEVVRKKIELTSGMQQLVPLHLELCRVYSAKLQDEDNALLQGEAVFTLDPNNLEAIKILEQIYRQRNKWERLVTLYEKEAQIITDPQRRIALYLEIGQKYLSPLSQPQKAIAAFKEVLRYAPTDKEALKNLVRLFTSNACWDELLRLYDRAARMSSNKNEVENLHLKMAEILEQRLDKPSAALRHYQVVYQRNPSCLAALRGLRRIYEQQQRWYEVIRLLQHEATHVQGKNRALLDYKRGEIWEEKCGNCYQALAAYREVLAQGFHRPSALRAIALAQRIDDVDTLASLLHKKIKFTEDKEEKLELLCQLGALQAKRRQDVDAAIAAYREVLQLAPDNARALDALEELFRCRGYWQNLISLYQRRLQQATTYEEMRALHLKLAELYNQRSRNRKNAIKHYEKALELNPTDLTVLHTLQEVYQQWGYYDKLISSYQQEKELTESQEQKIALGLRIAALSEQRLYDDWAAIEVLEELLQADHQNETVIESLARLYRKQQRWSELIRIIQHKIELVQEKEWGEEGELTLELQMEIAQIMEQEQHDPEGAIHVYQQILRVSPHHDGALEQLTRLYRQRGCYPELATVLVDRIATMSEAQAKGTLYLELGHLRVEHLQDYDAALEAYQAARDLLGDQPEVLHALTQLYHEKALWSELRDTYEQLLKIQEDPSQLATYHYELGKLWRDQFADSAKAQQCFQEALQADPAHQRAKKALVHLYNEQQEWEAATSMLDQEIQYCTEPDEKVPLLTQRGLLYRSKLHNQEAAIRDLEAALEIDPEHFPALQGLAELYVEQEQWEKAENLYGQLILVTMEQEPDKLAQVYYEYGHLAQLQGKTSEALLSYVQAVEAQPDYIPALEKLAAVYQEEEQWEQALPVLEKLRSHKPDDIELTLQLGQVQQRLGQHEQALATFQQVLSQSPGHRTALWELACLHQKCEAPEQALEMLDQITEPADAQDQERILRLRSQLYGQAGQHRQACENYAQLENCTSLTSQELSSWASCLSQIGEHQQAHAKLQAALENATTPQEQAQLYVQQAQLHLQSDSDQQAALQCYQQALQLCPTDLSLLQSIEEMLQEQEDWDQLVQVYQYLLQTLPADSELKLSIWLVLGELYLDRLEQPAQALECYQNILAVEPEHEEALMAVANIKSQDPASRAQAVREHLKLLDQDPLRIASYHMLFTLYGLLEEREQQIKIAKILTLLRSANKSEEELGSIPTPRVSHIDAGALADLFLAPYPALRQAIVLTDGYMERVYPPRLENYGIRRKDRLPSSSFSPLRMVGETAMKLLGVKNISFYVTTGSYGDIYLENTSPPSLIMAQSLLEDTTEEELLFIITKALFYISQNLVLAYKLDIQKLANYGNLLAQSFLPPAARLSAREQAEIKRLRGALPRKLRKSLEGRTELWSQVQQADITAFKKSLNHAANCCALFAASLQEACCALLKLKGEELLRLTPQELRGNLAKNEELQQLLRFVLTKEYDELLSRFSSVT